MLLQQKIVALINEFVGKFSRPGDWVLDAVEGTFTILESSVFLDKNKQFVECAKDLGCVGK